VFTRQPNDVLACIAANPPANQLRLDPKVVEYNPRIAHHDSKEREQLAVRTQYLEAVVVSKIGGPERVQY